MVHHPYSFTIMEVANLLSTLINAASTCSWSIFSFISLWQTLHQMLMKNHQRLIQHWDLLISLDEHIMTVSPSCICWFNQKMGWALWASKEYTFSMPSYELSLTL